MPNLSTGEAVTKTKGFVTPYSLIRANKRIVGKLRFWEHGSRLSPG